MTLQVYSLNNGPQGTALTTGNSGASYLTSPGGSITFDSAMAASGAFGMKCATASGSQACARFPAAAPSDTMSWRFVFTTPAAPYSANEIIFAPRSATTGQLRVSLFTNMSMVVQQSDNTNNLVLHTGLAYSTKYEVSIWAVRGGSGTNISCNIYTLGSDTPWNSSPLTATGYNLGMAAFAAADLGAVSNIAQAIIVGVDDLQISDGVATHLTHYVPAANVPPTVTASAGQTVTVGGTASVTCTAVDSDGTIAGYSWAITEYPGSGAPTITGGTTASASFPVATVGRYIATITVTDNGGATGTDAVTIWVPDSGEVTPIRDINGTGATWTNVGGAAHEGAALADSSDSTYLETPDVTSTETTHRIPLRPTVPRSGGFTVTLRAETSAASAFTAIARLYDGTTLRKTWIGFAASTSWADVALTVTSAEAATIVDWNNMAVELGATL